MLISLKDSFATFNFRNTITYSEYFALLYPIFKRMSERVLEGDRIQLPFGFLSITKRENGFVSKGINWSASMALKRKMEREGITPLEITRNGKGQRVSDNGGEAYFIYFTDDFYYALNIGIKRKITVGEHNYRLLPFRSFNYNRQRIQKKKPHLKTVYGAY